MYSHFRNSLGSNVPSNWGISTLKLLELLGALLASLILLRGCSSLEELFKLLASSLSWTDAVELSRAFCSYFMSFPSCFRKYSLCFSNCSVWFFNSTLDAFVASKFCIRASNFSSRVIVLVLVVLIDEHNQCYYCVWGIFVPWQERVHMWVFDFKIRMKLSSDTKIDVPLKS